MKVAEKLKYSNKQRQFPLLLKVLLLLYVLVLVPVYWTELGPVNFLWLCDIALFIALFACWGESRLLASIVAIAVLLPELVWIQDFLFRIISGRHLFGLGATAYMFNPEIPTIIRALSLFHVFLPVLALWMLFRLTYDRRALIYQTGITWIVLPLSYFYSSLEKNINWVYGFGNQPQTWMPPYMFVAFLMVLSPVCIYLPTHILLKRFFSNR